MHVWIDGQCFQTASRARGIGRYVWEFLRAMSEREDAPRISLSLNAAESDSAIVAREALSTFLNPRDIHVWEGPVRSWELKEGYTRGRRLGEAALVHHINCIAPDIALSAAPFEDGVVIPYLPSPAVNAVQTCVFYDAIPYRFPDRYLTDPGFKKSYFRKLDALTDFDLALCISDFARRELNDIHPGLKAVNISAGISSKLRTIMEASSKPNLLKKMNLTDGYVLYVGANDWRKNIKALIDAYARLPVGFVRKHPLVLVSGISDDRFQRRDKMRWALAGLPQEAMVSLGPVTDDELVELYRGASVLVQPSFMEGFGLPSLEALTVGTLVLAADTGAVPEVVRSPALRFDPHDTKELATKLLDMVENSAAFSKPMMEARTLASEFTWQNTVRTAIDAFGACVSDQPAAFEPKDTLSFARQAVLTTMNDALRRDPRAPRALTLAELPDDARPRLLIDATYICREDHRTGIQRVVRQIIEHTTRDHPRDVHSTFTTPSGVLLDTGGELAVPPDETVRRLQPNRDDTIFMLDSSWTDIGSQLLRIEEHRLRGGKVVFCIYDLVALRAYGFTSPHIVPVYTTWFRYALMYATGFMCISRAVADELLELLSAIDCPRRIHVGYWQLGADLPPVEPSRFSRVRGVGRMQGSRVARTEPSDAPKFVMVGTMEPRKGYNVALDAFDILWADGSNAELTIIGKVGWQTEHTMERIKAHPELGRRLTWHAKVSDEELADHYATASALISASYVEGFGLPLVEAGHQGKPVIASDIPVFREVAKGASGATFFEVGNPEALAEAVRSFIAHGPDHPAESGGLDWPDWKGSAEQLYRKLTTDDWYRTHEPRNRSPFEPLGLLGDVQMNSDLAADETDIDMEVIDGPIVRADGIGEDYLVKVHNPTSRVWSSEAGPGASGGVHLSWKRLDPETLETIQEGHRDRIPFVLYPGDTHYVRFVLPLHAERDALLRFDAVQDGVGWFTLRD